MFVTRVISMSVVLFLVQNPGNTTELAVFGDHYDLGVYPMGQEKHPSHSPLTGKGVKINCNGL